MTAAAVNAKSRTARAKKIRQFITPEGVDLELRIASSGLRFGALLVDLTILVILLFLLALLIRFVGIASGDDMGQIIGLLGFFLLRTFWFIGFELGSRAATPGKRLMGIRVVARDGGRLTADAVVARNLIRELELFLPLMMLGAGVAQDSVSGWIMLAGVLWSLTLSLFLLFNRDRMRMGDLIAGTWVVEAPRQKLAQTMSTGENGSGTSQETGAKYQFGDAELAVYGEYELQTLERVLRDNQHEAITTVAQTICTKIGWSAGQGDERAFLDAFYTQLRAKLERDMRFGKRKADKNS